MDGLTLPDDIWSALFSQMDKRTVYGVMSSCRFLYALGLKSLLRSYDYRDHKLSSTPAPLFSAFQGPSTGFVGFLRFCAYDVEERSPLVHIIQAPREPRSESCQNYSQP
jgi:hypothetical protein